MLLGPLARGDVDVDAYHPVGATIGVVRDEAARLDPANLAVGADNAVLDAKLVTLLDEGAVSHAFHARPGLRVHARFPLVARRMARPVGQTMNGNVALGDLYLAGLRVVREAADQSRLPCQGQLHVAV